MPIYEYKCPACGHVFEELVSRNAKEPGSCPKCGTDGVVKILSAIGGISMGSVGGETPCGSSCSSASTCAATGSCPHAS